MIARQAREKGKQCGGRESCLFYMLPGIASVRPLSLTNRVFLPLREPLDKAIRFSDSWGLTNPRPHAAPRYQASYQTIRENPRRPGHACRIHFPSAWSISGNPGPCNGAPRRRGHTPLVHQQCRIAPPLPAKLERTWIQTRAETRICNHVLSHHFRCSVRCICTGLCGCLCTSALSDRRTAVFVGAKTCQDVPSPTERCNTTLRRSLSLKP